MSFQYKTITETTSTTSAFKVYSCLLDQNGNNAPTTTVLENTIGAIVWTRFNVGVYYGTLTGAFPENKTFVFIQSLDIRNDGSYVSIKRVSDDVIVIQSLYFDLSGPTDDNADDILIKTSIEIRVYP